MQYVDEHKVPSEIVLRWRDKREVSITIFFFGEIQKIAANIFCWFQVRFASNFNSDELVDVQDRRGVVKKKPQVRQDYTDAMPGTDRADQMKSYQTSGRRTVK